MFPEPKLSIQIKESFIVHSMNASSASLPWKKGSGMLGGAVIEEGRVANRYASLSDSPFLPLAWIAPLILLQGFLFLMLSLIRLLSSCLFLRE